MTVHATLFENWTRLASVVRERIELSIVERNDVLPADEIDKMVNDIVTTVALAISHGLQERSTQQQQKGKS